MDLEAPFKSETLRPIATLFLPGVAAIAPYVLIATHYNAAIDQFARGNTGLYVALLSLAALAVGFILEDLGSRLEVMVWDRLVEKETGVHTKDWYAFLNLRTQGDKVGHRHLRTLTMHLKFELAFGLALVLLWFGVLWLDSIVLLWSYEASVVFSAVILSLASYVIWESYTTVWVLARVRHLVVYEVPCRMQTRTPDPQSRARLYDAFLLLSAVIWLLWGTTLVIAAITSERHVGRDSGLFTGCVALAFAGTLTLCWWWFLTESDASGRRRGASLRFALAYALLAGLAQARATFADPPLIHVTFWAALAFAAAHLAAAHLFWAGDHILPEPHQEIPTGVPNAA